MSTIELFRVLGEDASRKPSPPKHILKKRKSSQAPKVQRYWPGKAPEYVNDDDSLGDDSDDDYQQSATLVEAEQDPRILRYTATKVEESADINERIKNRRARVETITVSEITPKSEVKEEKVASKSINIGEQENDRLLMRQRALEYRNKEEEILINRVADSESDEEEDEDGDDELDYYSINNTHESSSLTMAKPVFVPKNQRLTVLEKEEIKKEEIEKLDNEKRRLMERKKQTKELLVKKLTEDEYQEDEEKDAGLIDDADTLDEKEYELWKIRELKRIIRDREERDAHRKMEEEIERRRNMTEEEREKDNEIIDAGKVKVERGKLRFLQKYYHKGAFFMDKLDDKSEPLYARDFNAPTAEDCIDKSLLPKAMRVRRGLFGKQGQVKHTHLADVDTTDRNMPWNKPSKKFTPAGTKQQFDRPSRKAS